MTKKSFIPVKITILTQRVIEARQGIWHLLCKPYLIIGEDPEGVQLNIWGKARASPIRAPNHPCHKGTMT